MRNNFMHTTVLFKKQFPMNYKLYILPFLVFLLCTCDDFALYNLQDTIWENKTTREYENYKEICTVTITFGATTYVQETKIVKVFEDGKQTESTDNMKGAYDQFDSNIKLMYVIDGQYIMRYGTVSENTIHINETEDSSPMDYYRIQ